MKNLIKATLITLTIGFTAVYAETAEEHAAHEAQGHKCAHSELSDKRLKSAAIQEIAKAEVKRLASQKKIPKSWKSMPITKIGKDAHRFSTDWQVIFENSKIKKKDKQNLYIFVGADGTIKGANYTGR